MRVYLHMGNCMIAENVTQVGYAIFVSLTHVLGDFVVKYLFLNRLNLLCVYQRNLLGEMKVLWDYLEYLQKILAT